MAVFSRPTVGPRDAFGDLAKLWIVGLNTCHDVGCACGGSFSPTIDVSFIERDLCDVLAKRYREEQIDELVAVIEARAAHRGAASFDAWLSSLGGVMLSQAAQTRLVADLREFLESLATQSRFGVCY